MKYSALFTILTMFFLLTDLAAAESGVNAEKMEQYRYIEKLDKINFLPSLLPVIIENSDVLELNDEQLAILLEWREKNREDVVAVMNQIAGKLVEIKQAALSPDVSSARLIQMQNEVFRLQRKVLEYKLSCRDLVINTFNRNNWEGFYLALAEKEMGVSIPELALSKR
jgi:hypothetical protein